MPYLDDLVTYIQGVDWDAVATKITGAIDWVVANKDAIIAAITGIGVAFASWKIANFAKDVMEVVNSFKPAIKMATEMAKAGKGGGLIGTLGKGLSKLNIGGTFSKLFTWIGTKIPSALGILSKAFGFLTGPIGITIMIVSTLVGAFMYFWNTSEAFRQFWIDLWDNIKSFCGDAVDAIVQFFTVTVPDAINGMIQWFSELPENIWTWLTETLDKIGQFASDVWDSAVQIGSDFLNGIMQFFEDLPYNAGYALGTVIRVIWEFGSDIVSKAIEIGSDFVNGIVEFFTKLPSRIWTFLTTAWTNITTWGTQIISEAIRIGGEFLNGVIQFFMQLPGNIWNWLVQAVNNVITWGAQMVNTAATKMSEFLSTVGTWISQLPTNLWTWFSQALAKLAEWGQQMVTAGAEWAGKILQAIVDGLADLPGKLWDIGTNAVNSFLGGLGKLGADLWNGAVDMGSDFIGGIGDALGIGSPSKVMKQYGKWTGQGYVQGFSSSMKDIRAVMNTFDSAVMSGLSKAPTISPNIQPLGATADKLQRFATGGTVTTPRPAIVGDAPETIVPHGNTPRNRALLSEAARGVGADLGGNTTVNITFAPVINGDGNAEENRKMIQEEEEEFERKMDAYFAKKGRLDLDVV